MSEETPRFGHKNKLLQEKNFSGFSGIIPTIMSSKKKLSLANFENKKKSKISKIIKDKSQKKRHRSDLFKMRKYDINNINEFIAKHEFKLRNDFDKKNSEKSLSSKEKAFEKPFLEYE